MDGVKSPPVTTSVSHYSWVEWVFKKRLFIRLLKISVRSGYLSGTLSKTAQTLSNVVSSLLWVIDMDLNVLLLWNRYNSKQVLPLEVYSPSERPMGLLLRFSLSWNDSLPRAPLWFDNQHIIKVWCVHNEIHYHFSLYHPPSCPFITCAQIKLNIQ